MSIAADKVKFIESVFGAGRLSARGENVVVRCPLCDSSDHTKRKLSIRLDDDLNHCWVCGWSACNLLPLLVRYGHREDVDLYKRTYLPESHHRKANLDKIAVPMLPPGYRLLLSNMETRDPDVLAVMRYATSRGLTKREFAYYALGMSEDRVYRRRLIIPSFDDKGFINYVVARAIDDKTFPRYLNSENSKTDIIFNEIKIDWKKPLAIVEGPFDLVKCPDNSTCLLGSEMNESHRLFSKILEHGTDIILCLDNDARKKADRIALMLTSYNIRVSIARLPIDKDPGALTRGEMKVILTNSSIWSRESCILDRIKNLASRSLRI